MIQFDRIIDGIFVGTCPASDVDVARLAQAGFSALLNLQTEEDFRVNGIDWQNLENLYYESGISAYHYPIIDFDDDDLIARIGGAARTLDSIVENDHRVYVHCTAGKQRSPSTVICWLAWHRGMELERAIDTVMQARQCAPPLEALKTAHGLHQTPA